MTREKAIKIVKEFINGTCLHLVDQEALETLIPELTESEDERMMREFNDWLCEEIECRTNDLRDEKDRRTLNMLCYILTKVKDWLEKQKEQKPVEKRDLVTQLKEHFANTTKEQLEAEWKELEHWNNIGPTVEEYFHRIMPVEWSEEDDKKMIFLERLIEYNVPDGQYGWVDGRKGGFVTKSEAISMLKSLRPSWKPSEEHLSALLAVFNDPNNIGSQTCQLALTDLYEQLKKL